MKWLLIGSIILCFFSLIFASVSVWGVVRYSQTNCVEIEQLKEVQREAALATIAGDRAFLQAHPGGTTDFPEAVVLKDIADKQRIVARFAPETCD